MPFSIERPSRLTAGRCSVWHARTVGRSSLSPLLFSCASWALLHRVFRREGLRLRGLRDPSFDSGPPRGNRAVDDGQYVIRLHDEVRLAVERDLLAGKLAEEDPIARADVEGDPLASLCRLPMADGDDRALLRLFLGAVGDDDSPDALFGFLNAANYQAVVKRSDLDVLSSVALVPCLRGCGTTPPAAGSVVSGRLLGGCLQRVEFRVSG